MHRKQSEFPVGCSWIHRNVLYLKNSRDYLPGEKRNNFTRNPARYNIIIWGTEWLHTLQKLQELRPVFEVFCPPTILTVWLNPSNARTRWVFVRIGWVFVRTRWVFVIIRCIFVRTRWVVVRIRCVFVRTGWVFIRNGLVFVITRWFFVKTRWVSVRIRWIFIRTRCIFVRTRWVFVRTRWVFVRIRWVFVRTRWVFVRTRWVFSHNYVHHCQNY